MGIFQDVWIDWSGPVVIRHPFGVTDLPLPQTNQAVLRISAELANNTDSPVEGRLRGRVRGTEVRFEMPVALGPKETKEFTITPKPGTDHPRDLGRLLRCTEDLKALQTLPLVKLKSSCQIQTQGAEKVALVQVKNPSGQIAFFVQLALTKGRDGAEILPVLWDDNYFSLLPGESCEITARFGTNDAGGATPVADRGELEILGMMACTSDPYNAPCLDAYNTYFGRPGIPIGTLKDPGFHEDTAPRPQRPEAITSPTL
jgi:hypothetical protein